jgi:hypothetical protein
LLQDGFRSIGFTSTFQNELRVFEKQQMSLVPWNGIDVKQVRHDLVQAEPQRMRLPQRAAIVHEVSSDDEENLRMDASSGLEVTVLPSTLTQT